MKLFASIFAIVFFLFLPLFFGGTIFAQSCLGSQTCCPAGSLRQECTPNGCIPGFPGCSCQQTCNDVTQACGFRGNSCGTSFTSSGCDYIIGSCFYTPGPPPGPTQPPAPQPPGPPPAGWGSCGSCDCGHPGQCVTTPVPGECLWDPSRCGGGGGGNPPPPPQTTCNAFIRVNPPTIESGGSATVVGWLTSPNANSAETCLSSTGRSVGVSACCHGVSCTRTVVGTAGGASLIRVDGTVASFGGTDGTCTNATYVFVNQAAWWQVMNGDVIARGNLTSRIPASCNASVGCNPAFNLIGAGNFPGLPIYGGASAASSYDFADSRTSLGIPTQDSPVTVGKVERWVAKSNYTDSAFNYTYASLASQIPPGVAVTDISGIITAGTFSGASTTGYSWYRVRGGSGGVVNIGANIAINGSRKVILLVEGADLVINGRIDIQTPGSGFFMALVGKGATGFGGNIIVSPTVSASVPDLEGLFFADGQFRTGTRGARNDPQLTVYGAVSALGGVLLQRDLGDTANAGAAAEGFIYAPEIVLLFPKELMRDRVTWQEVAP